MSQNLSSAAIVIGALRVKLLYLFKVFCIKRVKKENVIVISSIYITNNTFIIRIITIYSLACGDPEGGWGQRVPTPLENYKNIGLLTKLPSQHSILGHHPPANETQFKLCFAGGPLAR